MRMMFVLMAAAALNLQACRTGDSSAEEKKPEAGEAKESWADKAAKEAKKFKEKSLPYYASCRAEIEKYCKAEEKDLNKLRDCVKLNKEKFGPTCKAAVEKYTKDNK